MAIELGIINRDGFQHTYEGLKHKYKFNKDYESWSFQHTYEGLKPGPGRIGNTGADVFSIPMRD